MHDRRPLGAGILALTFLVPACRREQAPPPESGKAAASPVQAVWTAPPTEVPTEVPTLEPEPTPTRVEEPKASRETGRVDDLELIGIVRGATGSSAVIAFKGNQEIFRKGDVVFDHGTVKDVRDDSVVLRSGSKDVTLKLAKEAPQEPPPAPPSEKLVAPGPSEPEPAPINAPVSREEARAALKDLSAILSKADARRVAVGGGHGLELGNTAGFLAKLGLRSGDILQKLNGVAIDDLDNLPDLSSAAGGKELTVSFWRNDVGLTVTRRFE